MKKFNIRSNVNFIIENFDVQKIKRSFPLKKITIKKGGLNRGL